MFGKSEQQAKMDFINSPEGEHLRQVMQNHNVPLDQVSDTMFPDDLKFDGSKVVSGGVFCSTVGEYKATLDAKDYDMGGWSG